MHICYIADARSSIAKNWISYFVEKKHRITVISSYPCARNEIPGVHIIEFPIALSSLARVRTYSHSQNGSGFKKLLAEVQHGTWLSASMRLRSWIAPFDIRRKTAALRSLLEILKPDLVHAMRLPFEGFLAAAAVREIPLLISIWGNDFTLFADKDRQLDSLTRSALARADALHCDCQRDFKAALARGFSRQKPWQVLPGNGGVRTESYFRLQHDRDLLGRLGIPQARPLIINPRGFRAYVRNETFFRAIPIVRKQIPNAFFIAPEMEGNPVAERWIRRLKIVDSIRLLPLLAREDLARLFANCAVSVSPSSHDGTPNTLLEAMACGCFPIAGNVDSIREWIAHGENGLICDEQDPESLAESIILALRDETLRTMARAINQELIRSGADYATSMMRAEQLYRALVAPKSLVASSAS